MAEHLEHGRYLDVQELASYIRSTPASVRQLIHRRRLPFIKRGSRVLFDREEIDRFLAEHSVEVPTDG